MLRPLTIVLLACCLSAAADPTLTLGQAVVDAQGRASIDVTISASDRPISAIQFDIQYDYQTIAISQAAGGTTTSAGKSLMASDPRLGTRRLLIAGLKAGVLGTGAIATLSVQAVPSTPGVYTLVVTNVIAADADGYFVAVSADNGAVTVPGPAVAAVANAASYSAGAVAPGEAVVIWGRSLGGATARFDGIAAPLIYTTPTQLCAVVPYELAGRSQSKLQVESQGISSAPFAVPVGASAPGLFALDGSGQGQGAILNQDNSVNGPFNPAARGTVVTLFGTGEGQTIPAGVDGRIPDASSLAQPVLPVTASIGGQAAEVIYAGSAPGQVSGILQVNLRVPSSIAPAAAVPVIITIGIGSQSGVTIAVQ